MASVALIGPDGAGKTTLCRMLERSSLLRFKYVYMGNNVSASNVTLPTTALLERMRRRTRAPTDLARVESTEATSPVHPHRRLPRLRATLRLFHRLAEEWYRQLVSWGHQLRGNVVLYDRHFVFDFWLPPDAGQPLSARLHTWFLTHLFPRPTLVIYLEAPPEMLFARKHEKSPEILKAKGKLLWECAQRTRAFARVDASQPLEKVYADVAGIVVSFFDRGVPAATIATDLR